MSGGEGGERGKREGEGEGDGERGGRGEEMASLLMHRLRWWSTGLETWCSTRGFKYHPMHSIMDILPISCRWQCGCLTVINEEDLPFFSHSSLPVSLLKEEL